MSDFILVWTALGTGIAQGEKEKNEKKAEAAGAESQRADDADEPDA
jgi:hypothetical protein